MCGAHRKPPEPKFGKLFAYRALMHDNTEALFDQVLQVDTPPTHHAVHLRVRTRANDLGKFRLLRGAQVRRAPWCRAVRQARKPPAL